MIDYGALERMESFGDIRIEDHIVVSAGGARVIGNLGGEVGA